MTKATQPLCPLRKDEVLRTPTFKILTPQLRLIWISPGGVEGYFRDMSEPALALGLPEHQANYGEMDMAHALRAGKEHGISFLSSEEIRQQMPPLAKLLALEGRVPALDFAQQSGRKG